MENKKCVVVFHVFVYKTKYPIYMIIYVTIPRGDSSGRYGDKRDWQVLSNFNNKESKLPTSRILQSGRKIVSNLQNSRNHVKCT
jgi:hypothetical protein